jgi:hypothetical protein
VNSLTITRAKICTKLIAVFIATSSVTITVKADWTVDFSRRSRAVRENDLNDAAIGHAEFNPIDTSRQPASISSPTVMNPTVPSEDLGKKPEPSKGVFEQLFDAGEPVQEIVILNTDKGFVPNTVRVRKNARYKITVVNVNEKEKNISFILDGYAEHHATYFGKVKSFALNATKEGVFSFQSPETAAEGKLVVYAPAINVRETTTVRAPASEK